MSIKTVLHLLTLSALLTPPAMYAVTPSLTQSALANGTNASITLTLPTVPKVGNSIYVLLGSGIYSSRTMTAPDSSWTCTYAAQVNVSLQTCSHIVIPGDGLSYTFTPTSTNGPSISGVIFEAANTVSAQVAYSYSGSAAGNVQQTTSPSLTPLNLGMLPVAAIFGGQATAGSAGWSSMQVNGKLGAFLHAGLTTDTSTPVATTFNIPGYNSGSSMQELLLLAPGVVASAPTLVPVAGSYPAAQSVVLGDVQTGTSLHYTLDGSTPTCSSAVYSSPINVPSSMTIASVACASGYSNSAVITAKYLIGAGTLSGIDLGPLADLHGYVPFQADAFHQTVTLGTVDPNSAAIVAGLGGGHLHHDWSSVAGGNYGIPYTVVDSSQTPLVPFTNINYSDESDLSLYPIPVGLPIESYPNSCQTTGDNHAIVIDKHTGVDYELYQAQYCPTQTPAFSASNGVIWDMTTNEHRPYGYTSVDAAGLSVFEGLVRYDEIVAGVINHAIRFTTAATRCDHYYYGDGVGAFVAPATHASCTGGGTLNIIGMRIRLKASFDISGFSPTNQIILQAMKTYGMILADNGSSMYFQGSPDARWNDDDLVTLDGVQNSNFEVMQMPTVYTAANHPTGAAPVINSFTASSPLVAQGQSVNLNASVTGASYMYVDKAGFFRGSFITVTPTQTTTYLLTTRNAFGETTATTTVTVQAGAVTSTNPNLAFNAVPDQTFGVAPFTVSATSQSTGVLAYSVVSGPAIVSGTTVQVTGIGTVTLAVKQAAVGSYSAAQATTTFNVTGPAATLVLNSIANVAYGSSPFAVTATSNSSGSIVYTVLSGPATIAGNTVTTTGVGIVTIQATQQAAGNYTLTTAHTSFTVTAIDPRLSMVSIANKTVSSAAFTVSAVSLSSGSSSYSVTGPAVILGNVISLTGAGTVTVTVTQVASGNYAAATASTAFTVTGNATTQPSLSFVSIPSKVYPSAPFSVNVTSLSSGQTVYAIASGPASVLGNVVTLTGPGTVQIVALQAASGNYAASTAGATFTVTAKSASLPLPTPTKGTLTPLP